ncbi:MAG: hypothetical protein E7276_12790 [Pseudobutyrivibrio sp.]|nr:hypothetical protein [Pseudobutyrivibrio sp.]
MKQLNVADLLLCTYALRNENPKGIVLDDWSIVDSDLNKDSYKLESLFKEGILTLVDNETVFSDWGQRLTDIIVNPDVWIELCNKNVNYKRYIYLSGVDYICLDLYENDEVRLSLLPTIPLLIGAYAKMIELFVIDNVAHSKIVGSVEEHKMVEVRGEAQNASFYLCVNEDGQVDIRTNVVEDSFYYIEVKCVNTLTEWIFRNL